MVAVPSGAIRVSFDTAPERYRHWRLEYDGPVATLTLDVADDGGLTPGYELKLNSYDLGVDIELYDAVQRLRFEHPEVRAVVVTSAKDKVFCAGANIRMLATASHPWKVNFCKFTNETRNAMEDATAHSGQVYLAAVNGTASGGGYELALACEQILLVDDGSSAVSMPEVPLLGVLPGTGGLTRLVDKRRVRRDRADVFATRAEGVRGRTAVRWRLVDECAPPSAFADLVRERATECAARSTRPAGDKGIQLTPLDRHEADDELRYPHLVARLNRETRHAEITVRGPNEPPPEGPEGIEDAGFWPLAMTRELDDLILRLRCNELELGTWVLRTEGDPAAVAEHDRFLEEHREHWLVNELRLYLTRTLKRLDLTSRTLITLVEPGSCFTGPLAELVFAADRAYMLDGVMESAADDDMPAALTLTGLNFGAFPMANGLSRLATRFLGDDEHLAALPQGVPIEARQAEEYGLVTAAPDDLDWDDEIRLVLEERASFSPDALTGMEANLRFAGPETLETKIFARLSAWQNWIFNRPNAAGEDGALRRYGSGQRPDFDHRRV